MTIMALRELTHASFKISCIIIDVISNKGRNNDKGQPREKIQSSETIQFSEKAATITKA